MRFIVGENGLLYYGIMYDAAWAIGCQLGGTISLNGAGFKIEITGTYSDGGPLTRTVNLVGRLGQGGKDGTDIPVEFQSLKWQEWNEQTDPGKRSGVGTGIGPQEISSMFRSTLPSDYYDAASGKSLVCCGK